MEITLEHKADCSKCKNARALKKMPYCSIPHGATLPLLIDCGGGCWKTQNGEDLSMCMAFDPIKPKIKEGAINPLQQILPGVNVTKQDTHHTYE